MLDLKSNFITINFFHPFYFLIEEQFSFICRLEITVSGLPLVDGNLTVEKHHSEMESEILTRLKTFSLSTIEVHGVDLLEEDICVGLEEGRRSLVGKMFAEKKNQFRGGQKCHDETIAAQRTM